MWKSILSPSARVKSLIGNFGRARARLWRASRRRRPRIRDTSRRGGRIPPSFSHAGAQARARVFAVQLCDETGADFSGANRFAFVSIGTIAEGFAVHSAHHS